MELEGQLCAWALREDFGLQEIRSSLSFYFYGDNDGEYFRLFVFSKIMLDFLHENVILICENLHIKLTKEKARSGVDPSLNESKTNIMK